jgi:protein-S-isoprenylcysteine O-methyltransferase Ste14
VEVEILYPASFTVFQIYWAFVWAVTHIKARRLRLYAENRAQADTNRRYELVSYLLYIAQNVLCIASFWSNSQLLLKVHNSNSLRFVGVILISFATVLYFKSLRYLGRNYSPCFDSQKPLELIRSGPYKSIRHPMYIAKLIIVIGNFIISGSLWFVPMFIYLMLEIIRTIVSEERCLATSIPGYADYQKRTSRMIPFVF